MSDFSGLIGQEAAEAKALDWLRRRTAQSVLICGERGSGKKQFAGAIAKALLCMNAHEHEGRACGHCPACRYAEAGTHPDCKYILIPPDEKQIKLDDLRSKVISDLPLMPQISARKVYIIDMDGVREQGQNLLLKSIEEPPEHCVFILLCNRENLLLETLRSRLMCWRLRPLSAREMGVLLRRGGLPDEAAAALCAMTDGSFGQSAELLGSDWFLPLRELLFRIFASPADRPLHQILSDDYEALEGFKTHWSDFLMLSRSLLHDIEAAALGVDVEHWIHPDQAKLIRHLADTMSRRGAFQCRDSLRELIARLEYGQTYNLNFEMSACTYLLTVYEEFIACQKS